MSFIKKKRRMKQKNKHRTSKFVTAKFLLLKIHYLKYRSIFQISERKEESVDTCNQYFLLYPQYFLTLTVFVI